jgi:hypothetical protein
LRQVIGSIRGKQLVQVTLIFFLTLSVAALAPPFVQASQSRKPQTFVIKLPPHPKHEDTSATRLNSKHPNVSSLVRGGSR